MFGDVSGLWDQYCICTKIGTLGLHASLELFWSVIQTAVRVFGIKPSAFPTELWQVCDLLCTGCFSSGLKCIFVTAVPAAAYIKSQAYVSLAQSRSGHFIDASLRSILESALQPDDNDLFLTNLVSTPLMAIHGFVHLGS